MMQCSHDSNYLSAFKLGHSYAATTHVVLPSPNPAQVSEHLRKKHNTTAAERRQVTDLLEARIPKLRNPSDAPIRGDGSLRNPNLHLVHMYTFVFPL
ncbi:hypothetical protein FOXYSP1_17573 [Fusarium oxysporum f. sp. phaseoli]